MGQYWKIINIDKEETGGGWGKLGELLFDGAPKVVVNALALPAPPERSLTSVKYTINHSLSGRLGYLQFPDEILDEIFSEVCELQDVACLCVTNSHLLQVGIKHAEKLMKSKLWIGDRIICIGDYVDDNDLPQGLLTEDEKQRLKEYVEGSDSEESCGNLYSFTDSYREISFNSEVTPLFRSEYWKYYMMDKLDRKLLQCLTSPSHSGTGPYALCNLSKWEYVSGKAMATLTGSTTSEDGPVIRGSIGFGEVLFTQICWSSDGSTSMMYDGPIHRGVWAGDRIAIVRMNEMPPATEEGKEWRDVSERVLDEVDRIWPRKAEDGEEQPEEQQQQESDEEEQEHFEEENTAHSQ